MYTRPVNATATRAGVSCLSYSGAQHLAFIFFSRLKSLDCSERVTRMVLCDAVQSLRIGEEHFV
ncbi:MAG: hypothetical protein V7638_2662 [Acidobacteriota bacterium]